MLSPEATSMDTGREMTNQNQQQQIQQSSVQPTGQIFDEF